MVLRISLLASLSLSLEPRLSLSLERLVLLPGPHSNRYRTDNRGADQCRAFRVGVGIAIVLLRGIISLRGRPLRLIGLRRNALRLIATRAWRAAVGIPFAHVVINTTDGWKIRFCQLDALIGNAGASRIVGELRRNIGEGRPVPHGRNNQSHEGSEDKRAQIPSTANFLICPQDKPHSPVTAI